jgi:hypothetical protein
VNDATYAQIESEIETWTPQHNIIGLQMRDILEAAAFSGHQLDEATAKWLSNQTVELVNDANAAASLI